MKLDVNEMAETVNATMPAFESLVSASVVTSLKTELNNMLEVVVRFFNITAVVQTASPGASFVSLFFCRCCGIIGWTYYI